MEVKNKIGQKELVEKLSDFKSDDKTYVHRISDNWQFRLSQGCFFVRESANAYWLFDLMLSYQSSTTLKGVLFQEWSIRQVKNGYLQIICKDRSNDIRIAQIVKKRKFPIDDLTIYITNNHALLKSEY